MSDSFPFLDRLLSEYTIPSELWIESSKLAFEELNTPRSLACWILLNAREHKQLLDVEFDPRLYLEEDKDRVQRDFIATELLRKFQGIPGFSDKVREEAALQKAASAETECLKTNTRILEWTHGSGFPAGVEGLISRARRKIIHVLGSYDLGEHLKACRWGPGSDALNKRPYVSSYHKFKSLLAGTKSVAPFVSSLLEGNYLWATWLCSNDVVGPISPIMKFIPGNGSLTVPKSAKTNRFICIEPGANVYLQLGLGSMIRRRLRRVGIDLNSQDRNQMFALEGSESGLWATIDLSSASDTIARRLVHLLFSGHPELEVWFRVLEALRSPFTNYGSAKKPKWTLNHKFSSMGNGYTFELETLIFWALSSSAAEEAGGECAAVYGDDIIVSNHVFDSVSEILNHCGFTVNRRKSYNTTPFRESCGMNAWHGYELKSYRLQTLENLSDVYSLHNGLLRCGLKRAASYVIRRIPRKLRFYGPAGAGDGVIHSPDISTWDAMPHGVADQWFFWSLKLKSLVWKSETIPVRAYEPALLHSFSTKVPLSDHPVYTGNCWGSEGLVTLTDGCFGVGEILVSREALGLSHPALPG